MVEELKKSHQARVAIKKIQLLREEGADPLTQERDIRFAEAIARGKGKTRAARRLYGIKGSDTQIERFIEAKLANPSIDAAVTMARLRLDEADCLSRAEKRLK